MPLIMAAEKYLFLSKIMEVIADSFSDNLIAG